MRISKDFDGVDDLTGFNAAEATTRDLYATEDCRVKGCCATRNLTNDEGTLLGATDPRLPFTYTVTQQERSG